MEYEPRKASDWFASKSGLLVGLMLVAVAGLVVIRNPSDETVVPPAETRPRAAYEPRRPVDTGGFSYILANLPPWKPDASLEQIGEIYRRLGYRKIEEIDRGL